VIETTSEFIDTILIPALDGNTHVHEFVHETEDGTEILDVETTEGTTFRLTVARRG
jgi:hypothetical protein